ncbi:MAG: NupC/NupG family nucleoside CNT transporter [Candidatus Lightella neohaematopini]|nr:NupC/NupG family nucleoside CNT transporter [Candidatus Lightella neohaematopini]MCV2530994.1 NupC/NupG family nucleoside CNT transporter [Candidatus Lightella neohaematopini]
MFFNFLHFLLTIIIIIFLTTFLNKKRGRIKVRFILQLLLIEILLAYMLLHSSVGLVLINLLSNIFNKLLTFAFSGTEFVFGGMYKYKLAFFFITALCPIVFISVLIGILQYIRVLPIIIITIGTILSKISGMGKLESFNVISSLMLGQSENFIAYKNILYKIPKHRMYNMAITAMSTVSMSIIGSYIRILSPKYVITAIVLNIFSTFIILLLLNPYDINCDYDINIKNLYENKGFFEMLSDYIITGFKVAIIIAAMLIGFISLISMINYLCNLVIGINFQELLGYIFSPFAWIIGIPKKDIFNAGSIMATKLVSNEFVAMMNLKQMYSNLSSRSIGILSVFLVSFANFSSIGVVSGSIKSLDKNQGDIIAKYGFNLVYSSTLVSVLSAAISGILIK